jgi:YVTN family beta-propeller protein
LRLPAPGALVLLALLAPAAAFPRPAGAEETGAKPTGAIRQRAEKQGVAVEVEVAPVAGAVLREGKDAAFRFMISDTATGTPVSGAYPAAWLDLLTPRTAGIECNRRVEQLISGSLFERPAIDLNVYFIFALNDDGTITVVDPLLGFGGTRLLALIELGAPGEDWVFSPDASRLYVSVPKTGRVAVIDTASFKVLSQPEVGPGAGRLALTPDGGALWVTLADSAGVAVLDTAAGTVARVAAGEGRHELALSDDGRLAFVTNGGSKSVSVIDAARREKLADLPLAAVPSAVAFSSQARAAYVASAEAGTVEVVDAVLRKVTARVEIAPGLAGIRFAPGGRLAFLPNPETDKVSLLDAASNRVVQTAAIDQGPDQVTFSGELAYVRRRRSEVVLMIPLKQVGEAGKAVPVIDFPGGDRPLGEGSLPSPAASIVRAPGADAVLVANPADKTIYYYREGMAAPMGGFANYGRQPRAVLTLDRTVKERGPGRYETLARLGRPGRYRLALFVDAPRAVHCFDLEVAANPALEAERRPPLLVNPLFGDLEVPAGKPLRLRFRAADPKTGTARSGLADLGVLAYLPSGGWHQHFWAREVETGLYEVEFEPPAGVSFKVAVECPSLKLPYSRTPERTVTVAAAPSRPPHPPRKPR